MTDKEKAQAYDEALKRAKKQIADYQKELDKTDKNSQSAGLFRAGITAIEMAFPELKKSEDERIRKLLVWQVYRNIEDETNDLAGSIYDGIKGHDPDLEESIEDWKKCLAWLEKQKEQKPAEWEDYKDKVNIPYCSSEPEWSEEDEKTINDACCWIAEYAGYLMDKNYAKASMLMCLTDKLKSLRPSWKPSEEQLEELNKVRTLNPGLDALYQQLKNM